MSAFSDNGVLGIYAGTGAELLDEFVPALCGEIARLAGSLSEDEIERARVQLKSNLLMGMESTGARSERAGQQMLLYDRVVPVDELVAKIEGVTREALADVAERTFASVPSLASVGPVTGMESFEGISRRLVA